MQITVKNLSKSFGKNLVLKNISFEVPSGSIISFLGPNGAGKTTTINILTGLLKYDGGEIFYDKKRFDPNDIALKKEIGVVPQHNNIDRDLTVEENLLVHAILYKIKKQAVKSKIRDILSFIGLAGQKEKKAGKLSGGMKRRLVIGRALLHNPKIIFLDEPTTGLDPATRRHMWDFIKKINIEKRCTIILTTHYIEEAETLSHYVYFMDMGKIIKEGTVQSLKSEIGNFVLEIFDGKSTEEFYFQNKEDAVKKLNSLKNIIDARIREVNLEDVYLKLTGKKIDI